MFLWLGFLICTAVIVYSGIRLSKYGDIIAEKTGLGRMWIGVVLMASVTSLPELVTGISSVTYAGVPNIAIGDVLGSCVFNMLILAFLDAIYKPMPISAKAHHGHILSAGFGILLLSIIGIGLFLGNRILPLGWIGQYSLMVLIIYFVAMRLLFVYERRRIAEFVKERVEELRYEKISTRTAVVNYVINAMVVIIAAIFLPKIGEGIAETTGLGQTFVGNIFIALSTSLPEVIVSISAVKMGAIDLAVGNLFGSNIFNIFILAIDDMFFVKGPILSFVNASHIISALSAILMTAIAIIGLTYRSEKKKLFLAWDSIGILFVYVINLMLLYALR
ncbi:MAG: sodium:proton exchanger [Nitrospirae bacterium CG_4_10_14_3_um_filter_44_29]|nr:sodium:calcium antiporter [Nitrospirota bacterium]PIP70574.1 MAG: sodium:proton exchanger [Nitrospirae bacterium CG22_combo_CG10-13_8_21_14_all_44_11]PIV40265.1 MAG: sodium:proton exchanger [Nitrospirae bacterium CG02_land_8_20_14_3_00_44_33]PIV65670.1 MAG: sodium:proton exchanger [Nitrospirae bacterium CG01_land_8_20_14_3_00_44_22]PIW88658.1 MAG: sodium:proton exchanger [Nitrospirae bacterium CG_4_8_14_3_um_filter_44_28]PIX89786.1 MAG: sodium:proton exchanger [Nitrospirae bacterium CG_4_10